MPDRPDDQEITIRRLKPDEVTVAAEVLAESLLVEPGYVAITPDEQTRRRLLRLMFTHTLGQSIRHNAAWGAFAGSTLVGVAEWNPPGLAPGSIRDLAASLTTKIRMLVIDMRSTFALAREDQAAMRYFPDHPFWYLQGLGVSPSAQGMGIGSKIIRPGLEAATNDGLAAYLETGTAQNVRFYSRFGFEVLDPAARLVAHGPTHWTMIRYPGGEGG